MRNFRKLVSVSLLIACVMMMLMACGGKDSADKEADNQSSEQPTTTETPTTTEEPTTEEPSTEYVFKGYEFAFFEEDFNLKNDLTINPGDVIYINDYVSNQDGEYDSVRGSFIKMLFIVIENDNAAELTEMLMDKYMEYGDSKFYIPYADNYSFEYVGDKKVIFKFIEYNEDGEAVYDVYKE